MACDLTNEWWEKFNALSPEKLERAKEIIALNKFKDGEYQCDDVEIEDVLWYYKTTRNDAEKQYVLFDIEDGDQSKISPRLAQVSLRLVQDGKEMYDLHRTAIS